MRLHATRFPDIPMYCRRASSVEFPKTKATPLADDYFFALAMIGQCKFVPCLR